MNPTEEEVSISKSYYYYYYVPLHTRTRTLQMSRGVLASVTLVWEVLQNEIQCGQNFWGPVNECNPLWRTEHEGLLDENNSAVHVLWLKWGRSKVVGAARSLERDKPRRPRKRGTGLWPVSSFALAPHRSKAQTTNSRGRQGSIISAGGNIKLLLTEASQLTLRQEVRKRTHGPSRY